MRKVAMVVGLAAFLPFPAFAENQMLDGTYKLLSATRKIVETSEVVDSYGKHPTGYISYGKDGHFLVLIVYDRALRPSPTALRNDRRAASRPTSHDGFLWRHVHVRRTYHTTSYRYFLESVMDRHNCC